MKILAKVMRNLAVGLFLVLLIIITCSKYYDQGIKDYKIMLRKNTTLASHSFVQNPPSIRVNCWQQCEEVKNVSWDEYVKEYHKYMKEMK